MLRTIKQRLSSFLSAQSETEPGAAYNMWAEQYDAQPDNLMLAMDEALFSSLITKVDLQDKVIADIGCGTGRHWEKLYAKQPGQIIGYDVSEGMLKVLKTKYPQAKTHLLKTNVLESLENESCDVIISTLAIAHIKDIEEAFAEWNRALKSGGHIIITDYHPDALAKGGNRTFTHNGKCIAVKNYVHPLVKIKAITAKLGLTMQELSEKKIDETVKHYYEKQNALSVYEKFKGTPIIYGAYLTKPNVAK